MKGDLRKYGGGGLLGRLLDEGQLGEDAGALGVESQEHGDVAVAAAHQRDDVPMRVAPAGGPRNNPVVTPESHLRIAHHGLLHETGGKGAPIGPPMARAIGRLSVEAWIVLEHEQRLGGILDPLRLPRSHAGTCSYDPDRGRGSRQLLRRRNARTPDSQ